MNLSTVNQDSVGQNGLDRFEDMEHVIGHFTSELDALETDLGGRNKDRPMFDPLAASEVGILLVHLRGWRDDASRIVEITEACEQHIVANFRRQGEDTSNGYYARRADHYQELSKHLRFLAGDDA
ncbi:MAG: hypothetical protein H0W90_08215 [Actinobacteria bacterium]|nr:hypothetical protein [Actinomycetota bacterium]